MPDSAEQITALVYRHCELSDTGQFERDDFIAGNGLAWCDGHVADGYLGDVLVRASYRARGGHRAAWVSRASSITAGSMLGRRR